MSTTPDAPAPDAAPRRAPSPDDAAHTDRATRGDRDVRDDGVAPQGTGDAPAPSPTAVDPARRRRLLRLVAGLAGTVLAVDQLTKAWAVRTLTEGERSPLIGDLLGLTLLYNPGAALSIATGMTWVLTAIAVVVVVVTVRASRRIGSRRWAFALGLLLGGAIGNLVDRFLRDPGPARGHVVDFIAYGDLFVGNVADIAIVGAAGLIMLLSVRGIGLDGTRERGGRHVAGPEDATAPAPSSGAAEDPSRG